MAGIFPRSGGEWRARLVRPHHMDQKGIPPYVMAFAVMVALLLLPALVS
jgi:hypothetical protein